MTVLSAEGEPKEATFADAGDFVPAGTTKGRSPSGGFVAESPFGNLRGVTYKLVSYPTLAGRGGSDSPAVTITKQQETAPPTHSGILYGRKTNSNRSYSSGEGVWGRGASLREAASPPESPQPPSFGREREGGCFSIRKAPSLAINSLKNFCSCRIFRRRTCGSLGSGLGRWPHESAP